MAKKPLTDEQKARRAETARANGAKSRGPKTPVGKYISALNSIITGEHLGRLQSEVPPCIAILSTEDRTEYLRILQNQARQMQPASECEYDLVRHMAVQLFHCQRYLRIENTLRQAGIEGVLESYTDLDGVSLEAMAYRIGMRDDKMWRALQRDQKSHLASFLSFQKAFRQLRRDTPMVPPEPVSLEVEMKYEDDPLPPPFIVDEAFEHAERAKSEPNYTPPKWVDKLLNDKELMAHLALRGDLEKHKNRPKLPNAA